MVLASILLAVLAFVAAVIGFLTTPIPVVGLLFSFGAAGLALVGMMLGGRAVSKARRSLGSTDAARVAVVLNTMALVPAGLVAMSCGVCNAVISTGEVDFQRSFGVSWGTGTAADAGSGALPIPDRAPTSAEPDSPDSPPAPPPSEPAPAEAPPPPSQMPPPPLPAGPRN